jgi:hypothetical protein
MIVPSNSLKIFAKNNKEGFCDYPNIEKRIKFWDSHCREQIFINDDSIPHAYLSEFDQGLYGGLFDGDVRFLCDPTTGWISSMVSPLLKDWNDFESLIFSRDCFWYKRFENQLEKFVSAAKGKYGISHFILINGLNFIFELVGATQTYLDAIEKPEKVKKAIELAYKVNLELHQTFFEKVPLISEGTISNITQWFPGKIISESIDPFHMANIDFFEKWGREPVEKIFSKFDGGVIHIHSNGRHLLKAVSTLKGLKAIYLLDEKGNPPVFELLTEIKKQISEMPVVCNVDFLVFLEFLKKKKLPGGVYYHVVDVPDIDSANRCMDIVRKYRL